MPVAYDVVLSTGSSLTAAGVLVAPSPLMEGQQVEHYGQEWLVASVDDRQSPPVVTLRSLQSTG